MHNFKGVPTPMDSTVAFPESDKYSLVDSSRYWKLIGKIHCLSFTCSDIAFEVR